MFGRWWEESESMQQIGPQFFFMNDFKYTAAWVPLWENLLVAMRKPNLRLWKHPGDQFESYILNLPLIVLSFNTWINLLLYMCISIKDAVLCRHTSDQLMRS